MAATKCAHCGTRFTGKRRTAKYCSTTCRVKANNARRSGGAPAGSDVAAKKAAAAADNPPASLVEAVEAELTGLGKQNTSLGVQALEIARRMAAPLETGASVASLSRELRSIMVLCARGVDAGDQVDDLKRKRDEKRAQAARTS